MIMSTYKRICITNRNLVKTDFLQQIHDLFTKEKIDLLILREKDLSATEYEKLAREVLRIKEYSQTDTKVILHSFVSVAKELAYPHIHLTMQQMKALSEDEFDFFETIGVSTHSVEEAIQCEQSGASYITASHIFPTDCKKDLAPRGLSYLREVKEKVKIPVYALGGITEENMQSCIDTGADGICQMSMYMKKEYPNEGKI